MAYHIFVLTACYTAHGSRAAYAILKFAEQNRPISISSKHARSMQCDRRKGLNAVGPIINYRHRWSGFELVVPL
jgi:hypothetical protein